MVIAHAGMAFATWCACRTTLASSWEGGFVRWWDHACKWIKCVAAVRRRLGEEVVATLHWASVGILPGNVKLFDSIDLCDLTCAFAHAEVPCHTAATHLQIHVARRRFEKSPFHIGGAACFCLDFCWRQYTRLHRATAPRSLERPKSLPGLHADDMAQTCHHRSRRHVVHAILITAEDLLEGTKEPPPQTRPFQDDACGVRVHRRESLKSANLKNAIRVRQNLRLDTSGKAKSVYELKTRDTATFCSPTEAWVMPAPSSKKPEEREFVVDSGASMHMLSKKHLSSAELDTLRQ